MKQGYKVSWIENLLTQLVQKYVKCIYVRVRVCRCTCGYMYMRMCMCMDVRVCVFDDKKKDKDKTYYLNLAASPVKANAD